MKDIFLLFTLISSFLITAQTAPSIQWQKSLGGTNGDIGKAVQQTADGGFIMAGYSSSNDDDVTGNHGYSDYWIVKMDSLGNFQWQKSFGGSGLDYAQSIQQTADGGFIVAGYSDSNDGDVSGSSGGTVDYWIVKLDSTGVIQWQKSLGGTSYDMAQSIQQTVDGGYIIGGYSGSNDGDVTGNHGYYDYWIVKLDSNGNIQWQKSFGGNDDDRATSTKQTADGGYIIAGSSRSNDGDVSGNHGNYDYWIVKIDSNGNIQWQKSFGGSKEDFATAVQQTSDSGYIVAGYSSSSDGDVVGHHGEVNPDYWILKLDINGNIQWQKTLGGAFGDLPYSVQQTNDGGYIIAGATSSKDGDVSSNHGSFLDFWIVKLTSEGIFQWEKPLGGFGDDIANSIQQTIDGGYIIVGESSSNDGDVTGHHGLGVIKDVWIVKLSAEALATEEVAKENIIIYPNPVQEILKFSEEVSNIKITDFSGRTVKHFPAIEKAINVSALTKGVYIISATAKTGETIKRKILKE